jgi:hypothetical protein
MDPSSISSYQSHLPQPRLDLDKRFKGTDGPGGEGSSVRRVYMKAKKLFTALFFFLPCVAHTLWAAEVWNYEICGEGIGGECMSFAYLSGECMGEGGLELCVTENSAPGVSCAPNGQLPEEFRRCTGLGDPCGVPSDFQRVRNSKCLGGSRPRDYRCESCIIIICGDPCEYLPIHRRSPSCDLEFF